MHVTLALFLIHQELLLPPPLEIGRTTEVNVRHAVYLSSNNTFNKEKVKKTESTWSRSFEKR
jgi:hypothetical protein